MIEDLRNLNLAEDTIKEHPSIRWVHLERSFNRNGYVVRVLLFYQYNINQGTRLGIWKIEEDADFFLHKVPIHRAISHPRKRLQHLAGRYLMQHLFPYSLIRLADTRKPFLINEAYHFSISHCGDFAAAIVSKHNRVGMDIELVKPMIRKIAGKFIT